MTDPKGFDRFVSEMRETSKEFGKLPDSYAQMLDGAGGLYAQPTEEVKAARRAWFHETRARLTGEDLEEFDETAARWRRRGVDPETMDPDNWHPLPSARKRVAEFVAEALRGPR